MMAENELPIQITVEVNKAEIERQVGIAFSAVKDKAEKAGREIGDSMAKAMSAERRMDRQNLADKYLKDGADKAAQWRIQQTRDTQDYFAKTRTLESQWRIQQTRDTQVHFDAVREIERKTRIQQTRDTQDYFAKLNEARQKQQLLERRDMDEQRLRWTAEKQSTSRGVGDSNLMSAMMSGGSDATRRMAQLHDEANKMNKSLTDSQSLWGGMNKRLEGAALLTTQLTRAFFGLSAVIAAVGLPAIVSNKYLSSLEDAKLSIAGTLQAMAQASGITNDWGSSMSIAQGAIKQLDQAAIKYNISLEDVVNTFRGIVGVGMAAGMTLEQVGKIATVGTMAVKAFNLPSTQVLQEIKDLVQPGGIQTASSTLATALGITNEMTKKWFQLGTLFDELEKRMAGYTMAATERQNTLSGSIDILKMKLQRLFADESGFDIFKKFVKDISDSIGKINYETGEIEFDKNLISMMKTYWEQISQAVTFIGKLTQALITLLPYAVEVGKAFLIWYSASKVIPVVTAAVKSLGVAVAALPALFGSSTAAMMTVGVAASAMQKRVTALSLGAKGGVIGLFLFGLYEAADMLGLIDTIFSGAQAKMDQVKKDISGYSLSKVAMEYKAVDEELGNFIKSNEEGKKAMAKLAGFSTANIARPDDYRRSLETRLREIGTRESILKKEDEMLRRQAVISEGGKAADQSKQIRETTDDSVKREKALRDAAVRLQSKSASAEMQRSSGLINEAELIRQVTKATEDYHYEVSIANKQSKDSQRAEKERIKGIEQDFKREQQILDAQYSLKDKQIDQAVKYGLAEEAANIIRKSSAEEQLQATMALQDSYIKMLQSLTGLDAAQKINRDNKIREIQDTRELIEVRQRENQVLDEQRAIMKNLASERELGVSVRESEQAAAKMIREMDAEQKKKYTIVDPITFAGDMAEAKFRESRQNDLDKYTNKINVSKDAIESAELSWKSGITTTEQFLKVTLLQSEAINKATEAYNKQQAAVDKDADAVRRKAEEDAKYNESFKGGAEQAFNEYTKGALTAADMTRQAFGNTFKAMEDGLVEFVKTGKLSFGSFVNTVIDGLIRMAAKAAVTNLGQMAGLGSTSAGAGIGGFMGGIGGLVKSFLPFANGAAFDGIKKYAKGAAFGAMVATSPMTAFANGGAFTNSIVNQPTMFKYADGGQFKTGLMGEAGAEAIMPLSRTSDGSLGVKVSGSQSGESNVVVNVVVNVDAGGNSDVQTNAQGMGKGIGDLIGAKVREIILVEQRPGGSLNRGR